MWLFRKRQPPSRTMPSFGPPYVGGDRWAALGGTGYITPQAAEALAAVASCVSLISETIAALPATVVAADDSRAVQPDHPLSRLAALGANENETWSDLIASLLSSALLRGTGLSEIASNARGQLAALTTVPFELCTPWVDDNGALLFDYIPAFPPGQGQRRRLLRDDVVLLKARSDTGLLGVSPLQRSAGAVQHALKTQTQSFLWMANAARPGGTLNSPNKVSKETSSRLKEEWDNNYSNERFAKTAVLPEGLEFKPLGWLTAEDAQIVERLAYSVRDISRIFHVPIFMLGDEHRATFASANAALSYFAGNTLKPWCTRLERAMQASVLSSGYRLNIDLTALLRADPDAFAGALLKMRQGGYVTANECRAMLSLPARDDGDSLTPPSVISGGAQAGNDNGPSNEPDDTPPPKSRMNGHAHA